MNGAGKICGTTSSILHAGKENVMAETERK